MSLRPALLVGAGGAAFGVAFGLLEDTSPQTFAAAIVMGALLGLARGRPRITWMLAVATLLALAPFADPAFLAVGVLTPVHAFCAGRWDGRWGGLVALAGLVGALELIVLVTHDAGVPALLLPAAAWGGGRALREREEVAARLAERVSELEEEREAHAALSVRFERARIASELHDIVAHAISVMVVQASAGQRLAHDPELTAETFDAIAGAARQAEEDMGRLVALLADDRPDAAAPDLGLVEELVARAGGSGLDVTLRLEGDREQLPPEVAQAAYRVVQEALTNALRYASGAAVAVLVRGERESLVVEVRNGAASGDATLAGAGTGHGLTGLRERLGAIGGMLEATPEAGGGWVVRARIPRLVRAG
jgi:signal transduction histidine kinase